MKDKKQDAEMDFNEALKRIANTKKSAIGKQHKDVALKKNNVYNEEIGEALKPPHPIKHGD